VTTHKPCGKSWAGLRLEHCVACCQTLSGTTLGDAHRVGRMDERRCLNVDEMTAKGWHLNDHGIWHGPSGKKWWE